MARCTSSVERRGRPEPVRLAILCSGQGTQHPEMFALTGDHPAAADVFAAATEALGTDPRILVRDTSVDIHGNAIGQVLCCAQALAAFVCLKESLGPRLVLAGYSIGELAAWGCAGVFDAATLIHLAQSRAHTMDAASGEDDGLAYVRGLSREAIDALCDRHGAGVAIVNPGDMVVLGGTRAALDRVCHEAERAGATKVGTLKVAVASHTAKLAGATTSFRDALRVSHGRIAPGIRLLSGIDGTAVGAIETGLDKLATQISQTINWAACLEACVEAGVDRALELGPGNALATMASTAHPEINARSLDDFRSLEGVKSWLARS